MTTVQWAHAAGALTTHSGPSVTNHRWEQAITDSLNRTKFDSLAAGAALNELSQVANSHRLLHTYEGIRVYERATAFLRALPRDFAKPDVSVDPDGEIAFDWREGGDLYSVSLGANGRLSCAGLLDGVSSSSTEFFGGTVPAAVVEVVSRFN